MTRYMIDDYGRTTSTVPATDYTDPLIRAMIADEWGDEFPITPRVLEMGRAEMAEASALLSILHELVGEQAAEVMAFLVTILHRRDGASMALLRWLRSLDSEVRA